MKHFLCKRKDTQKRPPSITAMVADLFYNIPLERSGVWTLRLLDFQISPDGDYSAKGSERYSRKKQ